MQRVRQLIAGSQISHQNEHRVGLFPANTLLRSSGCCYRGLRRPLFGHKPEETPLLAHGVGWFMPLAVSASELLLPQKTEPPRLTTVCYGKARRSALQRCISDRNFFLICFSIYDIRFAMSYEPGLKTLSNIVSMCRK